MQIPDPSERPGRRPAAGLITTAVRTSAFRTPLLRNSALRASALTTTAARASAAITSAAIVCLASPSWARPQPPNTPIQVPGTRSLQDDTYLLGPGDRLELKLFDAPELSGSLDVLNDGTVSLPLIGSVRLTGLSISQASAWLTSLYQRQLLRPQLLLRVVTPRPIRVALVGEVERPGLYSLTTSEASQVEGAGNTISGLPTVVDALQKAGGITLNANLTDVTLQRRLPGDLPRFKQTSLNLLQLLQSGDQLQNPFLFDGDTIRIGRADQPIPEAMEVAAANFSPQRISVNVVGEVKAPGSVALQASTPLVQAVMAAGGPISWRANRGNVELVRINRNGSATRERFSLNLSQGASNQRNPPLRDGDTVIVNRTGLAVASDALNAIGQPLTSVANVYTLIRLLNNTN
ncbi:MAG: polysaccharide biosynthesis/export family protein [Cyanobacteriota bacterium]|nr:polysaccharide biosynthesis/export family protein [Cyanobacteriota bacterium]